MNDGTLLVTTGNRTVDQALRAAVEAFEAAFPDRIRGYYLEGSYADGTGLATSDADVVIVFVGPCA